MNEEKEFRSKALEAMVNSDAGRILIAHINQEIKEGWEKFIALPVAQKTSKVSFAYQAKYEVLRDLKDWIDFEIKNRQQI